VLSKSALQVTDKKLHKNAKYGMLSQHNKVHQPDELTTREDLRIGVVESDTEDVAVMFALHHCRRSGITKSSLHIPQ